MQKSIEIHNYHKLANTLVLEGSSADVKYENLSASGQMLVDSASIAFIYKLENETEYIYVDLPLQLWPSLKRVIEEKLNVELQLENKNIELINIIDELQYLIHNIEGNSNYGDEMVKKVEEVFLGE